MVGWTDIVALEQRREGALHHLTIDQHIRHAAGHAQIVFEHQKTPIGIAHEIGSDNRNIDIARNPHAPHFTPVVGATVDKFARNDVIGEDTPFVVHIAQKHVQRGDTLRQTTLDN